MSGEQLSLDLGDEEPSRDQAERHSAPSGCASILAAVLVIVATLWVFYSIGVSMER